MNLCIPRGGRRSGRTCTQLLQAIFMARKNQGKLIVILCADSEARKRLCEMSRHILRTLGIRHVYSQYQVSMGFSRLRFETMASKRRGDLHGIEVYYEMEIN